ncbi:hypothetical protein C1I98_19470 [Spongiactinospora gelatinilytica]|uniref:ABC transporter substrate-binding protein n=1 Tax=Spongiactinospora gelatinilytica TaxID=2666298 RepID=A0A2W2GZP7_9ACTN|nr:hypothetical protein C1I98_19470 [Spongiactinospora gelatinilytica]
MNAQAASLREGFTTMDRLIEAAKKEGSLTVIGLPHDWVNYGGVIGAFSDKYGIKVTELEPRASSRREIDAAAQAAREGKTAAVPDVFDLGLDVAVANAGRFARYRVQTWQDIPDELKDHEGAWYAGYGGYMSIGYDPRKVPAPASFADLLKPGYAVTLPGSPLSTAAAFNGVMAASMSSGAAKAERGVRFFARLKEAGNLVTGARVVRRPAQARLRGDAAGQPALDGRRVQRRDGRLDVLGRGQGRARGAVLRPPQGGGQPGDRRPRRSPTCSSPATR